MMGDTRARKIQFGPETTHGTAVAATKILAAKAQAISADRKPRRPQEDVGVRPFATRSYIGQYLVSDKLVIDDGYFQLLPYLLSCSLKGGVTPAEQTASQGDYLWTFNPSEIGGVDNAQNSLTLETGDDVQAVECEYTMFEKLNFSGVVNQGSEASPVKIQADFFARQWTPTTFTSALSLPTCEPILAKLARMYLNTSWATVGTTEKTILRRFEAAIISGLAPKFKGSGEKYFSDHSQDAIDWRLALTIEGDAEADAIWDAYRAQSLAVVRLAITGAQIGTGLTHRLRLDFGGTWDEVIPMGDSDRGNSLYTAILMPIYDATGAKSIQADVVTTLGAL